MTSDYRIALVGLVGVLAGAFVTIAGTLIRLHLDSLRDHRQDVREVFGKLLDFKGDRAILQSRMELTTDLTEKRDISVEILESHHRSWRYSGDLALLVDINNATAVNDFMAMAPDDANLGEARAVAMLNIKALAGVRPNDRRSAREDLRKQLKG